MQTLCSKWMPPLEGTRMTTSAFSGKSLDSLVYTVVSMVFWQFCRSSDRLYVVHVTYVHAIDVLLILRPESELGSIQLFNVTSTNVVPFLAIFCTHNTSLWNKGIEFGNDRIYIYDFIKHNMLLCSDFTCLSGTDYFT